MAHRVVGPTTAVRRRLRMLAKLGAPVRRFNESGWRIFGVVRFALAVAVVSAVGLLVGVATGAIPGSEGKISACYGKVGGVLRVVDVERGEKCRTCSKSRSPGTWPARRAVTGLRVLRVRRVNEVCPVQMPDRLRRSGPH